MKNNIKFDTGVKIYQTKVFLQIRKFFLWKVPFSHKCFEINSNSGFSSRHSNKEKPVSILSQVLNKPAPLKANSVSLSFNKSEGFPTKPL